jgi:hypothetical protein
MISNVIMFGQSLLFAATQPVTTDSLILMMLLSSRPG